MNHGEHDERYDPDCPQCVEEQEAAAAYWGQLYRAEKPHREALAIAREDLDMPNATSEELMEAIQRELK